MKCRECNENEVLKINKPENIKCICKNGHIWYEEYTDNGGLYTRPQSYEIKLEDTLFPSEKILYNKVFNEIQKNQILFTSSNPEEITSYLIDKCKFNKEDIYSLFKKITSYYSKHES